MVFNPALRDWEGNLFVTAAIMNAEIRDRLNYLLANSPRLLDGVYLRTKSANGSSALSQVELVSANAITMSDGTRVTGWSRETADITVSGENGLDTGSEAVSAWYEVYAIQKSSDSTRGLLLHRADNPDAGSSQNTSDGVMALRDASARTAIAQGIQLTTGTSGVPYFVEVGLAKNGSPTGNLWITIETSSSGPSNTVIGETDKIDVAKLSASNHLVRLPIRNATTNMLTATQYYICLRGDFAVNASHHVLVRTATGNPYGSGVVYAYDGATWGTSGTADFQFVFGALTSYGSVTMPSGYDRSAKLGYVYNNSGSNFVPFVQMNRRVIPLTMQQIATGLVTSDNIHYLSTMIPATPVLMAAQIFGGASGAGEIMCVGIPDGYEFTRNPRTGGTTIVGAGAANVRAPGDMFPTECQAMYSTANITSNDGAIYMSSWEWF